MLPRSTPADREYSVAFGRLIGRARAGQRASLRLIIAMSEQLIDLIQVQEDQHNRETLRLHMPPARKPG